MDKYFESEEFREVLQRYEAQRDGDIGTYLDSDEYADVAEYYHREGRDEEAMDAALQGVDIFPGALAPLCFLARFELVTNGDVETAEDWASQIEDKSQVEYTYLKAEIMLADGRVKDANDYLEDHLHDDEDEDEYTLDVATLFMDYDECELASQWLQRCHLTDDVEYKELSARIMMYQGNYDECERLINELIDTDPYSSAYWNQLASSQLLHNNLHDAITSSEFSLAINPNDDEALLNKANALFTLHNYSEALTYYQRFYEQQPDNESAVMMIGFALNHLERHTEAISYLEKALTMAQDHDNDLCYEQTLQELTYTEDLQDHMAEALHYIDLMEQHLTGKPLAKQNLARLVHIPRGYIMLERQRFEEAVQDFQQAFTYAKGNPDIIYLICIAIYDNGYYSLAYKLFSVLFLITPDDWCDGFAYFARCCLLVGDMETYEAAVLKAVECNPEEAQYALSPFYPEGTRPEDYPTTPLLNPSPNT